MIFLALVLPIANLRGGALTGNAGAIAHLKTIRGVPVNSAKAFGLG
jgi:hypothetical protein